MSMEEFMERLEYLLSDIPEEEKADAIEYYRNYLEEAGPESEKEVISNFGSPERIAAIIRTEISGNLKDGGEFTEKGYEDERFKDPNYQVAKRYDLPEASENMEDRGKAESGNKKEEPREAGRRARLIVWILLLVAASPMLLGIGGGLLGLVGGLFGVLIAVVVVVGALTLAFLAAGIALIVAGFVSTVIHPLGGLLVLGAGVLILGIGFLGLALSGLFYGRFIPFLFESCVNLIQNLFRKRRSL